MLTGEASDDIRRASSSPVSPLIAYRSVSLHLISSNCTRFTLCSLASRSPERDRELAEHILVDAVAAPGAANDGEADIVTVASNRTIRYMINGRCRPGETDGMK